MPWPGIRDAPQPHSGPEADTHGRHHRPPRAGNRPLLALNAPFEVWGLHGFERLLSRRPPRAPAAARSRCWKSSNELQRANLSATASADSLNPNPMPRSCTGAASEPAQAARIEQQTRALFEPAAHIEGFQLQPFESGIELRAGRDKGAAASRACWTNAPSAARSLFWATTSPTKPLSRAQRPRPGRLGPPRVARNSGRCLAASA